MGLGDDIMLSGQARVAQRTDQRKCRVTYKGKADRWSPIWDNNPRIARPGEAGDFQEVAARGMDNERPYHITHTKERWTFNLDFRAEVGELYFNDAEKAFGAKYPNRIIVEPHIKAGASPNKRYPWVSWNKIAWMAQESGLKVTQLGPVGTKLLDGAEHIITASFRQAAAVIANARAVVLPEGGPHHAAAALGVPGVVIMGGFTPVELTGYSIHRNLGASLGEACGWRLPCKHCEEWMRRITPETVFENLQEILCATGSAST